MDARAAQLVQDDPNAAAVDLDEASYLHVGEWRTYAGYSDLDRACIEYAEKFCIDHLAIDQAMIDRLRQWFSDSQILDITYSIGSWVALGRTMQIMQVHAGCALRV